MEVDTPALGQYAITDPNIELFEVSMGDSSRFLQSSPEYESFKIDVNIIQSNDEFSLIILDY